MSDMMQALMLTAIKELEVQSVPLPAVHKPDDVIIKVRSVGVCGSDLHGYAGHTGRRVPPLIMGHEAAGEVVAVGSGVDDLPVGTPVAPMTMHACGTCEQCLAGNRSLCVNRRVMGMTEPGAYAEYVRWHRTSVVPLPDGLDYERAALAEPLSIALHAVGLVAIRPYDTVLLVGAGPIGLLILVLLRQSAAGQIIVSDTSDVRLTIARELGADITVNPMQDDVSTVVKAHTGGNGADVAFEAVGITPAVQQTIAGTRNKGRIVWVGNNHLNVEVNMQAIVTRELQVIGSYGMTDQDFARTLQMLADGKIPTSTLINRRAALSEGPTLFDDLLASPDVIKCIINF